MILQATVKTIERYQLWISEMKKEYQKGIEENKKLRVALNQVQKGQCAPPTEELFHAYNPYMSVLESPVEGAFLHFSFATNMAHDLL